VHPFGLKSWYSQAFIRDLKNLAARKNIWKAAIEKSLME
jgi:hypothetical protein